MIAVVQGQTGCHTEAGRRPVNQDAVLAVRLADGRELVAVADGMGGHRAGEVASQRAVETVWARLRDGVDLRGAVGAANAVVHAAASANPAWSGMGTTLVAMLRSGSSYEIANVGDSRAYRVTVSAVTQITADHSVMADALRESGVATEGILHSRWRNALTRALGTEADVEVDVFGPFEIRERHAILLCTDGLHNSISDDVLREHIGAADDAWTIARDLAAEAYRNGSSDNISAAVVLFGETDVARLAFRPARMVDREPVRRRRKKSRRVRRAEVELAVTIVLLMIVIAVLVRVW
jgi:PPM family protein phosphatase